MKKKILLSAMLLALLSLFRPAKANAQITSLTTHLADSTFSSFCFLPQSSYFAFNGTVTGTVTATYSTLTIYINWDDGSDTTFPYTVYSYGVTTGGSYNGYINNHTYTMPGTYTPYMTATTTTSVTATSVATPLLFNTSCEQLSGKLYVDANTNCIPDAGEIGLAYSPVWVVPATAPTDTFVGTWTDDTGYYSLELVPGNYTIITGPNTDLYTYWWGGYSNDLAPSCPASGIYTLTATSSGTATKNFGFACTPAADTFDMRADGYNGELVRGDTTWMDIFAGNYWWDWDYACGSLTTTVTVTLDPHLHYVSSYSYYSPGAPVVSGSTLTWTVTSAADFYSFYQWIQVYCDTFTTIGETLCNTVYASPTALIDPDLTNNTSTFCGTVLASWDPNELAVSPQGSGLPGYIGNETALSYNIRFQNTGTAPANNITVVDTLSTNIEMQSLHVITSTAPVTVYTEGNVVKFRFSGINLPDSTANPTGSVGSIVFGVLPKPGLAPNTQIRNQSSIYFDYNVPVRTNSVLNTIVGPDAVQQVQTASMSATVYPNPAGDEVLAKTSDNSDFTMTFVDMIGRTAATEKSANGKATANTQHLPTGLYIVNLTNAAGKVLTTKVTIQH